MPYSTNLPLRQVFNSACPIVLTCLSVRFLTVQRPIVLTYLSVRFLTVQRPIVLTYLSVRFLTVQRPIVLTYLSVRLLTVCPILLTCLSVRLLTVCPIVLTCLSVRFLTVHLYSTNLPLRQVIYSPARVCPPLAHRTPDQDNPLPDISNTRNQRIFLLLHELVIKHVAKGQYIVGPFGVLFLLYCNPVITA
jgi:hypothetical protein